jgi:hypothetical protein
MWSEFVFGFVFFEVLFVPTSGDKPRTGDVLVYFCCCGAKAPKSFGAPVLIEPGVVSGLFSFVGAAEGERDDWMSGWVTVSADALIGVGAPHHRGLQLGRILR